MNECSVGNCFNPVFSHGYCRIHQWMRKDSAYERQKVYKKQKKIPKESKKRLVEHKYYRQIKEELRAEMIANGTYNCFFCGQPMGDQFEFHHLMGRDGTYYIDPKYLVPGHRDCHVHKYHAYTVEQLLKESWYSDFLSRLKSLDPKLWEKEMNKQFKAGLFDDDN